MIAEGNEYIDVFPSLEWIYVGERAMCAKVDDVWTKSRRVVSISEMANGSYLRSMFGV
jgi:hypothetical protein